MATAWKKLKAAAAEFIAQANARDAVELMICGAVCGIVSMVWGMRADLATVSAKLEAANPVALQAKVEAISQGQLTRDDVALVMAADSWRRAIERELAELRATGMGHSGLKTTNPPKLFGDHDFGGPWVLPGDPSGPRPTGK